MQKARLEDLYIDKIRSELQKNLGIANVMQVPKLDKIVINVGVKEAISNNKAVQAVDDILRKVTGQVPVKTLAKKSIAGFKLREGMQIGVKVTLRKQAMYEFLDKLINLALPKVRDFQGVPSKFDGRGNYNLGIKEWVIFPELDYGMSDKMFGMNVTIHTTAETDEHGFALLKSFGMPFRKA